MPVKKHRISIRWENRYKFGLISKLNARLCTCFPAVLAYLLVVIALIDSFDQVGCCFCGVNVAGAELSEYLVVNAIWISL